MRELRLHVICNACGEETSEPYPVKILVGDLNLEGDACPACLSNMFKVCKTYAQEVPKGRARKKPKTAPAILSPGVGSRGGRAQDKWECPRCKKSITFYGRLTHMRKVHNAEA